MRKLGANCTPLLSNAQKIFERFEILARIEFSNHNMKHARSRHELMRAIAGGCRPMHDIKSRDKTMSFGKNCSSSVIVSFKVDIIRKQLSAEEEI